MNKQQLEDIKKRLSVSGKYKAFDNAVTTTIITNDVPALIEEVVRLRSVIENAIVAADKLGISINDVLVEKESLVTALQLIRNSDGLLIEPGPILTMEEVYGYCVDIADNALNKMGGDKNTTNNLNV